MYDDFYESHLITFETAIEELRKSLQKIAPWKNRSYPQVWKNHSYPQVRNRLCE